VLLSVIKNTEASIVDKYDNFMTVLLYFGYKATKKGFGLLIFQKKTAQSGFLWFFKSTPSLIGLVF